MGWLVGITDSMDMNLKKLQKTAEDKGAWCAAVHGVRYDLGTEQQQSKEVSGEFMPRGLRSLHLNLSTKQGSRPIMVMNPP